MGKLSAGLMVYRRDPSGEVEVLLVHPGGPFWSGRDQHAWSIPKGEYEPGEDPEATAIREFEEEIGSAPPNGPRRAMGQVGQPSRKLIRVWAVEGDLDVTEIASNTFELEWPKGSGNVQEFAEVDRAEWWSLDVARSKLHKAQLPLVDRLLELLGL